MNIESEGIFIDKLLSLFVTHDSLISDAVVKMKIPVYGEKVVSKALAIGIVTRTADDHSLCLTLFGHEVMKHGGWTKYLSDKEEDKRLSTELIRLSIKTNKLQGPLLWFTVGFSAATFIATIISLVIPFMDYRVHEQELQLEQNKRTETQTEAELRMRKKETVDPNQDSSANYAADSLGQKVK